MYPPTILAAEKLAGLLTNNNALEAEIKAIAGSATVPAITAAQVLLSSATADIGDKNVQFTYPRVCLYSSALKNSHAEKFVSLSGTVSVVTEIWASGNLVTDADQWIHFYVEAVTSIYRENSGDLGGGFYFSGNYEVHFQPPKVGGLGFSQSAKITCTLNVSKP